MASLDQQIFSSQLKPILKKVARSIYLSLVMAPRGARGPMALAYLLARAADTIADTKLLPAEKRLIWLGRLKAHIQSPQPKDISWDHFSSELVGPQEIPEERELLGVLGYLLAILWEVEASDRSDIQGVLGELILGMEQDLQRSPSALATWEDLDSYCYYAAGVVGPFWTRMLARHDRRLASLDLPQMEQWGVDYGKGLQLINVLKDIAHDFQGGRCYLPTAALAQHGLEPSDLNDNNNLAALKPILDELIQRSLAFLEQGQNYILALPRWAWFARLSALWPLWIGLETLNFLARDARLLAVDSPHKIPRSRLRALLCKSCVAVFSNRWLRRHLLAARKPTLEYVFNYY